MLQHEANHGRHRNPLPAISFPNIQLRPAKKGRREYPWPSSPEPNSAKLSESVEPEHELHPPRNRRPTSDRSLAYGRLHKRRQTPQYKAATLESQREAILPAATQPRAPTSDHQYRELEVQFKRKQSQRPTGDPDLTERIERELEEVHEQYLRNISKWQPTMQTLSTIPKRRTMPLTP